MSLSLIVEQNEWECVEVQAPGVEVGEVETVLTVKLSRERFALTKTVP